MDEAVGAVAAGHALSAEAGAEALRAGGNAVDAVIAACFASFVCESPLTGPGGGGFLLVHDRGRQELLDFFVSVPERGPPSGPVPEADEVVLRFGGTTPVSYRISGATVAVPGMLAGLEAAHRRYGRLPWRELLLPAVRLARGGVVLTAEQAYIHLVCDPILRLDEQGRSVYGGERPLVEGELVRFPQMADSLELLAEQGAGSYYRGELAELTLAYLAERGGLLSRADLASYQPLVRRPLRTRYHDGLLLTNPPPATGGILIAHTLSLLDRLRGRSDDPLARAALLVECLRASASLRGPEFELALYRPGLERRLLARARLEADCETVLAALAAGGRRATERSGSPSTTHVSALDREGQAAALSTSTGAATGMIVPGSGLSLNNLLGEADLLPQGEALRPGERLTSMMSPSLLLRQGRPWLSLGSAGSTRLRSAIVQVIVNLVERHMDLPAAIAAPRLHPQAELLHLEAGQDDLEAAFAARGEQLQRWPGIDFYFGGVNAVAVAPDGFAAAGDPRRGGAGVVV
jgi:gamma-glutamyltranspeptidase/glutathione hydrolase